jgi:hypothetical protein
LRKRAGDIGGEMPETGNAPAARSGGQTLAATVAAGGDDAAPTLGGHARAETVPALADEFGRLIGTLHLF